MTNLNSIILEGNAVKDIEIVEPVAGFKVGKFILAVNRFYKNKNGEETEEVSYFDCECYGKMTEAFETKIKKWCGIRAVGRLKQERWTDSEQKAHSKVFVVCEHIEVRPFEHEKETQEHIEAEAEQVNF